MSTIKKLASQTAIYGISAILSKFLNFLLTPYLTHIMHPDIFGNVSLWYGLIPFVNVLLTMGLSTSYFRWAGKAENEAQKRTIFTTFWSCVSTVASIFFILCVIFQVPLTQILDYGNPTYIVLIATLVLIDNIASIPLSALRQQGRAARYTVVNVTGVVVNIAACVGFYTLIPNATNDAKWVLVANILASGVSLLILIASTRSLMCKKVDTKMLRKVLSYSLPLMIAGVMGMGSDFLDRQMINWLLPADIAKTQVGIYGAVAKLASIMIIFRQIYTLGAEPFFLQNFKKEDFLRMNAAALKFFTIAGIVVFLGCSYFLDILILLLGKDYREGIDIVPLLLLANLLMGILVNLSFWYKVADKTRYAIYVTAIGVVTVVVACYFLVPLYGYHGAAYSHLLASVVMVVLSYIFNQANYRVPYQRLRILSYLGIGVGFYFAGEAVSGLPVTVAIGIKIFLLLIFIGGAFRAEGIKLRR